MRIGFTGTREHLTFQQSKALRLWFEGCTARELHHGDCIGADEFAHEVVHSLRGWRIVIHPGLGPPSLQARSTGWNELRPAKPNLERNRDIVNDTIYLVACPKGFAEERRSGTWSTVRYARLKGRSITIIWPDGTQTNEERAPAWRDPVSPSNASASAPATDEPISSQPTPSVEGRGS